MSYIVVDRWTNNRIDPTCLGEWWEGALVDDARARQLEARGVVLLPVIPDLFSKSGVGGFHKRSWGSGWQLDTLAPRIICPMTMFCSTRYTTLNWVTKIILSVDLLDRLKQQANSADPSNVLWGFLKICPDSSQAIPSQLGLVPKNDVFIKDLAVSDLTEDGAFVVRGTAKLSVPSEAHYGFGLYAMAPGLRVVWAAISQSS
jgi:hypothetical protein